MILSVFCPMLNQMARYYYVGDHLDTRRQVLYAVRCHIPCCVAVTQLAVTVTRQILTIIVPKPKHPGTTNPKPTVNIDLSLPIFCNSIHVYVVVSMAVGIVCFQPDRTIITLKLYARAVGANGDSGCIIVPAAPREDLIWATAAPIPMVAAMSLVFLFCRFVFVVVGGRTS